MTIKFSTGSPELQELKAIHETVKLLLIFEAKLWRCLMRWMLVLAALLAIMVFSGCALGEKAAEKPLTREQELGRAIQHMVAQPFWRQALLSEALKRQYPELLVWGGKKPPLPLQVGPAAAGFPPRKKGH